ncbi:FHA domain-containing protein [Halobaculum sp. MBLA0147]|uniref:FHA domain-containing protein n=1 Tax=Halobaculum sp. MBLA0147 TaxID=3079934 RepID=UPI00352533E3
MSTDGLDTSDVPPIFVSSPNYDDMGAILDRLGVEHSPVDPVDLSEQDRGVVMLNCSFSWDDEIDRDALAEFVERGNTLMASDLTARAVSHFTSAEFGSGNWGDEVRAEVVDAELADLLGREQLTLDFDTAIKEPTRLPDGAEPLLRARDRDSVIAYKCSHGDGTVVYTTFHNHSQSSALEDALLQVLLMVPIAESAGTTVTDTYTTVVADVDETTADDDTRLVDPETETMTEVYGQTGDHTETQVHTHETATTIYLTAQRGGRGTVTRDLPPGATATLGRSAFESVVDDDHLPYVSREHVELSNERDTPAGTISLRDADSANGTAVDGTDLRDGERHTLEQADRVTLADSRVKFVVQYD